MSSAATVMVMLLAPNRADLVVNGTIIRQLRSGQTSPEGVALISATPSAAVVQVDGKTYTLTLGQATATFVTLSGDTGGHFHTTAYLNNVPMRVMVDTGATSVALNRDDAQRLGIDYRQGQRTLLETANGRVAAWQVKLNTVQVGEILVRNVDATVSEGGNEQLSGILLGNSFLQHVDLQRSGNTMTISKRW